MIKLKVFITLNVRGQGYTTFECSESLHVSSDHEYEITRPVEVRSVLQRLSENLENERSLGPFFAAARTTGTGALAVGYGIRLTSQDERNRSGIVALFTVELEQEQIVGATHFFTSRLASASISDLESDIHAVAAGKVAAIDFIVAECSRFAESVKESTARTSQLARIGSITPPIRSVHYDVGGVPAGWLAMIISHAYTPAPWEIHEENLRTTRRICSTSTVATSDTTLSALILESMTDHLVISALTSSRSHLRSGRRDSKIFAAGHDSTPTEEDSRPLSQPATERVEYAQPESALPSGGIIAALANHSSDRSLVLITDLKTFRVTTRSCERASETRTAFFFVHRHHSWLEKEATLIRFWVPYESLSAQAIRTLKDFILNIYTPEPTQSLMDKLKDFMKQ